MPTEISSYENACKLDPEVQSFDSTLQRSTSRVITAIAVDINVRALSFDSLNEVTRCLIEMNQEVVKVILDSRKDIFKNPKLVNLVEEHLENSLRTLDFCSQLEKCLKRAREAQSTLGAALQGFESSNYLPVLEALREFRVSGDPFSEEFFNLFHSVFQQQLSTLEKLLDRKRKIDKTLISFTTWRKISWIIFAATFASVLICSVVAAAVAAPPVLTALLAASSIALGSTGKWIHSLWDNYWEKLQTQKELINAMHAGSYIAIKDLENIRVLADQLELQIGHMVRAAGLTTGDEEAVRFAVEEIRTKLRNSTQSIEDLGDRAERCSGEIRRVRSLILRRIINTRRKS